MIELFVINRYQEGAQEMSRGRFDSGLRKNKTLYLESESPELLYSFEQLFSNEELRKDALIDLDFRYKEVWNIVVESLHDPELESVYREKMIRILILTNFGSRLGNESLKLATHPNEVNDFGQRYREARKNPKNFDHGDLHERSVDAAQLLDLILFGSAHLEIGDCIHAVAAPMTSIYHDSMQLWMEDRIDREYEDGEEQKMLKGVNPKDYHTEAGAVFVQLLEPIIQRSGHLSDGLARRLVGALSENISVHDAPDRLVSILLTGEKKLASSYGSPAELYTAYESGELARSSLSRAEWLTILKMRLTTFYEAQEKNKSGVAELTNDQTANIQKFISIVYGDYGFGGEIERYFTNELEQMNRDAEHPQIDLSLEKRYQTYLWKLLFNIADTNEMIRPGFAAVIRKLRVHWSRSRRLFIAIKDAMFADDATEALKEKPNVRGHNQSDWCRQAREWIVMAKLFAESPFFQDPFVAEYIRTTYLENMLQAQSLYEVLAGGDDSIQALENQERERVIAIAEKGLRKGDVPDEESAQMMKNISDSHADRWTIKLLLQNRLLGNKYFDRFSMHFTRINIQIHAVIDNLRQKPGPQMKKGGNGVYEYSPEEITQLQKNFIKIWNEVCGIFNAPKSIYKSESADAQDDEKDFAVNALKFKIPNASLDSLGALSDARTINPLSENVEYALNITDP